MECPECSWYQLWIGIGIGAVITLLVSLFTLWLIKNPLKPKIEKRFDQNELNIHIGIMGYVNSFDSNFEFFFDVFENDFGKIQDLPRGEWIPDAYEKPTINETGGFDFELKPEAEYSEIMKLKMKLDWMNKGSFKNYLEQMAAESERILKLMDRNELSLEPVLRRNIGQYLTWTAFYATHLKSGWNYSEQLFKRGKIAQDIINILEKEKKYRDKPQISDFIKKWKDYEKSELNS